MIRREVGRESEGFEGQEDGRQEGEVGPTIRVLSLGAGVQSTTLALLAVEGRLPRPDAAIFADTRWEPGDVMTHLDRLEPVLTGAGIPLYRVSAGSLRDDALDPAHRYCSVPYFIRNPDGRHATGPDDEALLDVLGLAGQHLRRRHDHR